MYTCVNTEIGVNYKLPAVHLSLPWLDFLLTLFDFLLTLWSYCAGKKLNNVQLDSKTTYNCVKLRFKSVRFKSMNWILNKGRLSYCTVGRLSFPTIVVLTLLTVLSVLKWPDSGWVCKVGCNKHWSALQFAECHDQTNFCFRKGSWWNQTKFCPKDLYPKCVYMVDEKEPQKLGRAKSDPIEDWSRCDSRWNLNKVAKNARKL